MTGKIIRQINSLEKYFATAKQGERNLAPLNKYREILAQIDAFQRENGAVEGLQRAKEKMMACDDVFKTWATMGYQSSFQLTKRLLQTVKLEIEALAVKFREAAA